MPAATATGTRLGKYSILQAELPGQGLVNLGVLLEDTQADSLRLRLRRDLEFLVSEDELDYFEALAEDLSRKADELGSEKLFAYLEDTLSGTLRITDRETVLVEDFDRAVDRLYRKHVESKVLEFRTHLPWYSLRAAAGRFLDNEEIVQEGWLEVPPGMQHLDAGMFVAEIVGDSMEPLIPNGSLCVFRAGVVGSRAGRLVLAEDREVNAYAVKRYKSEKTKGEEWQHNWIRLEPLNPSHDPAHDAWLLKPDEERYRIIAEFVRVLD
ncbi:MAG TPA: S24 family peptidase [Bryobacteraceae bacterium]|jgi:SOS-response transcriptional repressor LexA|nr:S24 family peptidase [Bryobacteraceae bacterium]